MAKRADEKHEDLKADVGELKAHQEASTHQILDAIRTNGR